MTNMTMNPEALSTYNPAASANILSLQKQFEPVAARLSRGKVKTLFADEKKTAEIYSRLLDEYRKNFYSQFRDFSLFEDFVKSSGADIRPSLRNHIMSEIHDIRMTTDMVVSFGDAEYEGRSVFRNERNMVSQKVDMAPFVTWMGGLDVKTATRRIIEFADDVLNVAYIHGPYIEPASMKAATDDLVSGLHVPQGVRINMFLYLPPERAYSSASAGLEHVKFENDQPGYTRMDVIPAGLDKFYVKAAIADGIFTDRNEKPGLYYRAFKYQLPVFDPS